MKIAYLFLVHQNPRLLKRAIEILSTADSGFFVHLDRKTDTAEFSGIGGENVFFSAERIPVYWGEFSQVEATLLLMRQALANSAKYERLVFLQGSDYPLRSGRYVREFMEKNQEAEFISLVRMPAPGYPLSKINKVRYPSSQPFRHFASKFLARLGLFRRDYKEYFGRLEAYSGQACWALSEEASRYILDFSDRNPAIARYFEDSFTADEMFFHTILGNSTFRSRIRRNLVYLDWPAGADHPNPLGEKDLRIFEASENVWVEDEWGRGEVLFARKFSDAGLNLVDRLDQIIRRKDKLTQ